MPRLWIVSKERVGARSMGPVVRLLAQASAARDAGYAVTVVCPSWEREDLRGIDHAVGPDRLFADWRPGDPVVVDAYVPGRWLFRLLASEIPFDADFYCVSVPESAESFPDRDARWRRRERIRRTLKYGWILQSARRLYVSTGEQTISLAGMIAAGPDNRSARDVGRLPARCLELPMGCFPGRGAAASPPSPYPAALQGRPILLWGGGIWPWFDLDTLLEAMASLPDRDFGPALFFLSSSNHRPDARADDPVRLARAKAVELDLLDRNVFFNEVSVGPDELGPWLSHAVAGVMSNPDSWEARVSWRTRYLDLLSWGVPLVVSGEDPLARRMAAAGAALLSPAGDAGALRDHIAAICRDASLRSNMAHATRELSGTFADDRISGRWLASLRDDPWLPRRAAPVGPLSLLRFRWAL